MAARQHTLLVVDDEVDVLESLRHLFHRQYRVLTAGSGREAVELLQRNEVHLILSDQRMPGMTGDVFLGHARRLQPDAIRMLFTGYADIQAVINAVNEGYIFRYILKPWDAVELEGIVRQAAEQYELIAERNRLITELQAAKANLERANQELTEAGQLKSAFIEVASHEFNTPITLLLGLSELLRLLDPLRATQERELIERISASARQLAKLVANTLTLMRKDDFRRTLQRRPVDLGSILREVAEKVLPFVHARKLRFTVDLADDLGTFEIDPEKIADVIVNLLTNAIKFTPDEGEIALMARLDGPDAAVIRVTDRGIGVEPKALAQFFQPFFTQFNPSHHSSGDFGFNKRGLGLGLSIVKQFVELHGGVVSAESTVGGGTEVAIKLPRHPLMPQDGQACPPESELAAPPREVG
ncbi:MAG: hybrid sensor histidine kinase/response regulator [Isosphaeraceae bacterium]|nr:hybrid sensor histidine kinase/response regulator [Isosphaeraceae bacterium]